MTSTGPGNSLSRGSSHRYDFIAELGSGALGPLWAARVNTGPELGRLVAVRRISGDPGLLERLMVAGVTALRFRHPGVSAVLDVVQGGGELLVVSEYVDGESLDSLQHLAAANRTPLSTPVVLRIVLDVVTALAAARDHWATAAEPGALHGGLMPSSIFVAGFGDTLLSEVGVSAAAVRLGIAAQREGAQYRPPEQASGGAVDGRADVFAVGVLLWELLANRALFGASSGFARHSAAPPGATDARVVTIPRLDAVARAGTPVPRAIVELVARAVERDPKQRYSGPEELIEALLRLPREAIATPEQVVVAIDRLARNAIEARHLRLSGAMSPSQPPESAPGSNRPTFAPEAKTALASVLRKSHSSRPPRIDYIPDDEPTQRGGVTTTAPAALPAGLEAAVLSPPRPSRRRAPLVALCVILAGGALMLLALFYPRSQQGSASQPVRAEGSAGRLGDPSAPPARSGPPEISPPVRAEGSAPRLEPALPAQEGSASTTLAPDGADSANAPPAPAEPAVRPAKKPSKAAKPAKSKTFRPRGI